MKVLVVTHDFSRFQEIKENSSEEVIGCFRTYYFEDIVRENNPDLILSDGTCKKRDQNGRAKICSFNAKKELRALNKTVPVFPLSGWDFWLREFKTLKQKEE